MRTHFSTPKASSVVFLLLFATACGSTSNGGGGGSSSPDTPNPGNPASTATPGGSSSNDGNNGNNSNAPPSSTSNPTPTTPPGSPTIPKATGTCPTITAGDVTFAPAGAPPRKVNIALDAASNKSPGELLFYWYATGSSTDEAAYSLGSSEKAFTSGGGIVVTPYADPSAGMFEWFIVNKSPKLDDFLIADEVVACLVEAKLVDPTKIFSMGMSAGALQTTAFSFLRSSYVASVATFSGGMPDGFDPTTQDPNNKFAALIFDGGSTDDVFGVDFQAASQRYQTTLNSAGHFTAICDHGNGHSIPLDAAPSVIAFFAANPFGAWPSPYASSGLPKTFPTYCKQ